MCLCARSFVFSLICVLHSCERAFFTFLFFRFLSSFVCVFIDVLNDERREMMRRG